MKQAPLFSVVVPVYNRAHVLQRCLRSILQQSCGDFEIIVVDDGSHDDPKQIVQRLGDRRLRFIRQENKGGGAARNLGMDLARGAYIAFLDSDDEFLPHHLHVMKRLLHHRQNIAAYAPVLVDRGNCQLIKPGRALAAGEHMAEYLLADRGFMATSTTIVSADLARTVRQPENLRAAEDTDFAIKLFLAGATIIMAPRIGAIWHDRADPSRTSAIRAALPMQLWLDALKDQIPARAYYGCRGWALAKAQTNKFRALGLYLQALSKGCYAPRLALTVGLQIFLGDRHYRHLADWMIRRQNCKMAHKPGRAGQKNSRSDQALMRLA